LPKPQTWVRRSYPSAAAKLEQAEAFFRRASYAAVLVEPGMAVRFVTLPL